MCCPSSVWRREASDRTPSHYRFGRSAASFLGTIGNRWGTCESLPAGRTIRYKSFSRKPAPTPISRLNSGHAGGAACEDGGLCGHGTFSLKRNGAYPVLIDVLRRQSVVDPESDIIHLPGRLELNISHRRPGTELPASADVAGGTGSSRRKLAIQKVAKQGTAARRAWAGRRITTA